MLKHNLLNRSPFDERKAAERVKSSKSLFFVARKRPKNAKNLFDATPYAATTSDPIRAKNKNITGLEPRDLIVLDSSWDRFPSWSKKVAPACRAGAEAAGFSLGKADRENAILCGLKEHISTLIFTD
jgi:hypothetical protein